MKIFMNIYLMFTGCWVGGVLIWQLDWANKDAPAWVQAVGSVLAIFVAIGVSINQHRNDLTRDAINDEVAVLRLLLGLRDEVVIAMRGAKTSFGKGISEAIIGEGVQMTFYPSDRPFKIYNSNVNRIGIIPEDKLRETIIGAYARFELLLVALKINNDQLADYSAMQNLPYPTGGIIAVEEAIRQAKVDFSQSKFIEHGDSLIQEYSDCLKCAEELVIELNQAIKNRKN
ncbi:hypothetical protein [Herminiimonas fonticola]|uniref:Uncharacterized protein n=1 Tax=Herminiimonas fonticola TaxID=303380 RepID=A0A4R6GJY6_9BURK|nr:hypothetical protein [Herminiimonas fonticola]RBA25501.1 hypothetical protein Hfont_1134 [Herminiimonas fonticola]TDN94614.1 hypothetical protein EV677_1165 [Herminiimonas fonticola]